MSAPFRPSVVLLDPYDEAAGVASGHQGEETPVIQSFGASRDEHGLGPLTYRQRQPEDTRPLVHLGRQPGNLIIYKLPQFILGIPKHALVFFVRPDALLPGVKPFAETRLVGRCHGLRGIDEKIDVGPTHAISFRVIIRHQRNDINGMRSREAWC